MADSSPEPFGKLLLDARAARGMTLAEVSASTKIPVSKLQAIERDDIENLPGGIFTRGFVRSYAETVGLDPQETLAQFEARFPDESSVATLHATIAGRANEEFVRRQRTAKSVVWLALLAVPLVVWLLRVAVPGDTEPPTPEGAVVADAEPATEAGSGLSPQSQSSQEPASPPPVAAGAGVLTAGRFRAARGRGAGRSGRFRPAHDGDQHDGGLLGAGLGRRRDGRLPAVSRG